MSTEEQYWYNTETRAVEVGRRSSWSHLMGPYSTRAEAERALESARSRNESWDKEDEDWRKN
ncbi:SPOR domain-containing protein [Promicromonospora sp. NPDC019610]|uniref:SPOR domain-containing protein n=1 Tax=Promicromonospora sp. NPDC019610 TaxID=3364405 RepID=UPI0037B2AEEF